MRKIIHAMLTIGFLLTLLGAAPAAAEQDNQGFIYGAVTTESGKEYRGFLRWADEEYFWDDLFHSSKDELPHLEQHAEKHYQTKKGHNIKVFGYQLKVNKHSDHSSGTRVFIARFGDIEKIQVTGGNDARLFMKSGEQFDVSGYANDVGGTIHVEDESLGEINLHWNKIDTIKFSQAPRGDDPGVTRLYGKLSTRGADFEGFIAWDKEECVSSDELDGESEDGDVSIPMGRIESIERAGSKACEVVLKDGRTLRLRGTNDVNDSNRGIMVEDSRFGRVVVFWDEFDKLAFEDSRESGSSYGDFKGKGTLHGKVVTSGGDSHQGRIVFDLDETEGWEILNGRARDIEYNIPFHLVRSIEPQGEDESLVVLRNGEELYLEDSQDVTESNDGLLVFVGGDDAEAEFIPWRKVKRVEFDD
jgi:hypothetical protein